MGIESTVHSTAERYKPPGGGGGAELHIAHQLFFITALLFITALMGNSNHFTIPLLSAVDLFTIHPDSCTGMGTQKIPQESRGGENKCFGTLAEI